MRKKFGDQGFYTLITESMDMLDVLYFLKDKKLPVSFKLKGEGNVEYGGLQCIVIIPFPDYAERYGDYQIFFSGNLRVILSDMKEIRVITSTLKDYVPSTGVENNAE